MARRKPGTLLPLENEILETALALRRSAQPTFHGFGLAQTMREQRGSRALTSHGTLYKALVRLEELGMLDSRWEDAETVQGRPRRRLYELTGKGAAAVERVRADRSAESTGRLPNADPEPVSITSIAMAPLSPWSSRLRERTVTVAPSWLASMALASRFITT